MADSDLVRTLADSPWERAMREAGVEQAFFSAVVPVPCGYCGMFAATCGSDRCEHCVGKGGGR